MKQFNTNPRTGWVKSSESMGPEVLKEISRLSTENSDLRKEIEEYENKSNNLTKTLEWIDQWEVYFQLHNSCRQVVNEIFEVSLLQVEQGVTVLTGSEG